MAGLTQIDLADRTGVTQSAISQIENGEVSMTIQWMKAFARALDCAPADLLDDEDNPDRLDQRTRAIVDYYRHSTEQERATIEKVVPAISSYHPPEAEQALA